MVVNKLNLWNWKYEIAIDKEVDEQVQYFISSLGETEKEIYSQIRDYFRSCYSITQLLDLVENVPMKAEEYILAAERNQNLLMPTPQILYKDQMQRINHQKFANKRLRNLLEKSMYSQQIQVTEQIHEIMLGSIYQDIKEQILKADFNPIPIEHGEKIGENNIDGIFDETYHFIMNNPKLELLYGKMDTIEFDKEISIGSGFAEWWDRDLMPDAIKDKLILFKNSDMLHLQDFIYTILHEVYPGHGYFYQKLAHNNKIRDFDHGAVMLIEGWATYVETNSIPSEYADQIYHNRMAFLKLLETCRQTEMVEKIIEFKKNQGYSEDEAKRTILYITQYPDFLESYYIGALWLENYLKAGNLKPKDFIENLKTSKGIQNIFYEK